MKRISSCIAGLLLLLGIGTVSSPAQATWLGLDDGTYSVTLSCVFSSVIACPSTIEGTMTIAGGAATAFDFMVNGQAFVGSPGNGTATTAFGTDQIAGLQLSPFSNLSLQYFLTGGLPGLSQRSWVYCNNFSAVSCTPATDGNWTAVAIPEPPGLALFVLGLGLMAVAGMTRGRSA